MKKSVTIEERLRRNVLFENVGDEIFAAIRETLAERTYRANEIILADDHTGRKLYLIASGRVKITKKTRKGDETLLALLHHGDCFGELELIDGRHRASTVTAVEKCIVYELDKSDFDRLMHSCPPFAIRLAQLLSIRLRALNQHFVQELDYQNARFDTELEKLQRLNEATKVLNSTLDLDRLLTIILDTALSIVNADRGTLYLVDYQKHELWSKILKGKEMVEIRLPIGKGISGYVAATGDTLNIPDAYLDNRFDPATDARTGYKTKTILCMPMRNKEQKIIGVIQLLNKVEGQFTTDDEGFIDALSVHSSLAIENARLYEQERQKLALEKDVLAAKEVQISLLPKHAPSIPGYDIAGTSFPARFVGGDYFDFIPIDGCHTAICLGDVSGKGLPASLLMANLQATLRGLSMSELSPKMWVRRANNLLYQNTNTDKFVTLFFSVLDCERHTLCYVNAGHDHPFLYHGDGEPQRLTKGGIVVSVIENYPFEEETISLAPGDLIVVNSDGITEATNARKAMWGEKRLRKVIEKHRYESSQEIRDAIIKSAQKFTGDYPQFDDMTLVIIKRDL